MPSDQTRKFSALADAGLAQISDYLIGIRAGVNVRVGVQALVNLFTTGLGTLPVSVAQFGAVGDNATDDTAALANAAAYLRATGGGSLWFAPGKTYKVWGGGNSTIFDLQGLKNVTIFGNGATIRSAQVNPAIGAICFLISGIQGFRLTDLNFTGGNTTNTFAAGERFLNWGAFAGVGARNITVENCVIKNCVTGTQCLDRSFQSVGVTVLSCYYEMCFYPLSVWGTDNLTARITTRNCGRSYFPVNPGHNHDVSVDSQSGYTSTDCLMKVYSDSSQSNDFNTLSDIRLNYRSKGKWPGAGGTSPGIVEMDFQQNDAVSSAGHFRNIRINFDVDCGAADPFGDLFSMNKYTFAGAADVTARGHTVDDVVISGSAVNWNNAQRSGVRICDTVPGDVWTGDAVSNVKLRDLYIGGVPPGDAVIINCQPAVANVPFVALSDVFCSGSLTYAGLSALCRIGEDNIKFSNLDATDVLDQSYAVAWTGTGSNPVLGNGTLSGTWSRKGRNVKVTVKVSPGSTTTFGTGEYVFSLPVATSGVGDGAIGGFRALNSGVNFRAGVAQAGPGSASFAAYVDNVGQAWGPTNPWVFKNGDNAILSMDYRS